MADTDGPARTDGRSTRWVAHRRQRRSVLLAEAREVLRSTGPLVAMDELASAMGTSKSILYRYFDDRAGLRDALSQEAGDHLTRALVDAELQGWKGDAVGSVLEVYLEAVASHPQLYLFIRDQSAADRQADPVDQVPAESADGDAPAQADPLVLAHPFEQTALSALGVRFTALDPVRQAAAVGLLAGATARWLSLGQDRGPEGRAALATQVAAWLSDGVLGAE